MPQFSETRTAKAKINLALHVTGQREDGYHLLDTLVCFADFGDQLTIMPGVRQIPLVQLSLGGEFSTDLGLVKNNLVIRATELLAANLNECGANCFPVSFTLEKNLPVSGGLGGGSTDAAAALVLLASLWSAENAVPDLRAIAAKLGADVPMCLDDSPKRAHGIGENLAPFMLTTSLPLLLVNPGIAVSTPQIFNSLAQKTNEPICMEVSADINSLDKAVELLAPLRNDLEKPAISCNPVIATLLEQISDCTNCLLSRMSGSGATVFGIFRDMTSAKEAMDTLRNRHPDWWCAVGMSVPAREKING